MQHVILYSLYSVIIQLKCLKKSIIYIIYYSFKLDQKTANILFSIPYYLSALLSPIVGYYL